MTKNWITLARKRNNIYGHTSDSLAEPYRFKDFIDGAGDEGMCKKGCPGSRHGRFFNHTSESWCPMCSKALQSLKFGRRCGR